MGASMGIQILVSLYQMWIYPFHPGLAIQASDQLKIKAFSGILRGFGYEMIPEGNGWLVKESLRSWQFLHSIDEMETYVKEVQDRHEGD